MKRQLELWAGAGATFDPTRRYRYTLWRDWAPELGRVLWVCCNPSTADEMQLDPTLRRCVGFARAWGAGGIEVCNIFALRSTDPLELYTSRDPVGEENDAAIVDAALRARRVIVGWGVHGRLTGRGERVAKLLRTTDRRLECLGTTIEGWPRHPLYVCASTTPGLYR